MPAIEFSHPALTTNRMKHFVKDADSIMASNSFIVPKKGLAVLVIDTGVDSVRWGYGLNTQTFPTYAGEVVQILSAYIDNMEIQGTVRNYREMESIYRWFIQYFQVATQGGFAHEGSYDERPIEMEYPHRGWTFNVWPIAMPGLQYSSELIAPQWRMSAHVQQFRERSPFGVSDLPYNIEEILDHPIGYIEDNPFSNPEYGIKKDEQGKPLDEYVEKAADYFNELVQGLTEKDYDKLLANFGSGPAFLGTKLFSDTWEQWVEQQGEVK